MSASRTGFGRSVRPATRTTLDIYVEPSEAVSMRRVAAVLLILTSIGIFAYGSQAAIPAPEAKNMRLLGHHSLNGFGNGGEGLAVQRTSDGRRILYLAHESAPVCMSIVDVTNPSAPRLLKQVRLPAPVRCNSLALSDTTLIIAHQTDRVGQQPAGIDIFDVSNPADPRELAFFDTSGPRSRGAHHVGFVDGKFAYISTGAADFEPTNPNDDQFLMIVDVRDPRHPKEAGRWWYPGTRMGDPVPPPRRLPKPFDTGYRLHDAVVMPDHPTRAYLGYIDGGIIILDISDMRAPKMVGRLNWSPPFHGFTHTALPLFTRGVLVVSEESVTDKCEDFPKMIWIVDMRVESNLVPIATAPLPANVDALCKRGGRFGAHNVHKNFPVPASRTLQNTVVGSFFNGGVRIYSIHDPFHPEEIAYFVPTATPGSKIGATQINDMYVDEQGIIYTNDRFTGGLYILQYTGPVPLD